MPAWDIPQQVFLLNDLTEEAEQSCVGPEKNFSLKNPGAIGIHVAAGITMTRIQSQKLELEFSIIIQSQ